MLIGPSKQNKIETFGAPQKRSFYWRIECFSFGPPS